MAVLVSAAHWDISLNVEVYADNNGKNSGNSDVTIGSSNIDVGGECYVRVQLVTVATDANGASESSYLTPEVRNIKENA